MMNDFLVELVVDQAVLTREQLEILRRGKSQPEAMLGALRAIASYGLARVGDDLVANFAAMTSALIGLGFGHLVPPRRWCGDRFEQPEPAVQLIKSMKVCAWAGGRWGGPAGCPAELPPDWARSAGGDDLAQPEPARKCQINRANSSQIATLRRSATIPQLGFR